MQFIPCQEKEVGTGLVNLFTKQLTVYPIKQLHLEAMHMQWDPFWTFLPHHFFYLMSWLDYRQLQSCFILIWNSKKAIFWERVKFPFQMCKDCIPDLYGCPTGCPKDIAFINVHSQIKYLSVSHTSREINCVLTVKISGMPDPDYWTRDSQGLSSSFLSQSVFMGWMTLYLLVNKAFTVPH